MDWFTSLKVIVLDLNLASLEYSSESNTDGNLTIDIHFNFKKIYLPFFIFVFKEENELHNRSTQETSLGDIYRCFLCEVHQETIYLRESNNR